MYLIHLRTPLLLKVGCDLEIARPVPQVRLQLRPKRTQAPAACLLIRQGDDLVAAATKR